MDSISGEKAAKFLMAMAMALHSEFRELLNSFESSTPSQRSNTIKEMNKKYMDVNPDTEIQFLTISTSLIKKIYNSEAENKYSIH